MNAVTSTATLFPRMAAHRILVIEGARCSGKDHLISRFVSAYPGYESYEALKPRKKFMEAISGKVSNLPAGLEIQQSHLWSMDMFRQLQNCHAVVNRSMLSSLHFDGFNKERFNMWCNLLKSTNALVVLVMPSLRTLAKRIALAQRADESESIQAERAGIQRYAAMMEPENLLVFSESDA